ncbi:MAG TPA: peroxidase [Deltaproteobacteria bacterium]|nr:MAG: peroxidase [Deltaproteobacteria bacterium GWA2_65_63]OGP29123.1 MAG: peroxidase [Deltaproteobacteria bacterium GWB2_65_81]OGP37143.1 MAG: peroxidase [Deltaproteobacteria bacterium GWC2_66_88]RJP17262.1 MAG: peroxidase [Deltaproteobacteria bacterium]HAM33116.1 peroxidase [Deltaproteobacteria bacterium]
MPRIVPLDPKQAIGETADSFREIASAFGMIPNLFRTSAHHPPLLRANWNKVKAVMMEGRLSRKVKETIALLVSKDNGCEYCVAAHSAALRAIGLSSETVAGIMVDPDKSNFAAKEKALIGLARQANLAPRRIAEGQFQTLRELGATDAEIVEALGVMELFVGFNKFLDSLQVELDSRSR